MFYLKYVILEFAKYLPGECERKQWNAWERALHENGIETFFYKDGTLLGKDETLLGKDGTLLGKDETLFLKGDASFRKADEGLGQGGAREKRLVSGTLRITDEGELARAYAKAGCAVLGLLTEENGGRGFDGVPFLASDLPETEPDYLERVYRRQAGIPWDVLETSRCVLRETAHEDADALYEIYAEPSVTEHMEGLPMKREAFHAWLEDYRKHVYGFLGYGIWTVCQKPDAGEPLVIGRAGLSVREGYEEPELGFVIGKSWQGRGLAFEICTAILEYAGELEIPEVLSFAEKTNKAAKGLLLKLGFQEAGETVLDGRECVTYVRKLK